jgi:hypothetical protein
MSKMILAVALAFGLLALPAKADTVIFDGIVCNETCFGYGPGDDTPDYLGLFGPVFGNLMGKPVELIVSDAGYSLTINNHTLTFGLSDPHFKISFTDPMLSSFGPGAALFTATGLNPYGFAVAEAEYLCLDPPVPGVPEPATWAMFMIGFVGIGFAFRRKRRIAYW